MRAIQYESFGGYDRLRAVELAEPKPEEGQALVQMTVAGVSPLDDTVRAGRLDPAMSKPLPLVPGASGVGRVIRAGHTGPAEGTRVLVGGWGYGVGRDGTWRERVEAEPDQLVPIPHGVDDIAAAALTTGAGYLTAYLALTGLVPFRAGQTVLAPGIGGAVGQGGVEVALALGASAAFSTATRTDKAERGRAEGHEVIDLSKESLRDGVARLTGGRGVDVVLDGVGGPVTGQALASLAGSGSLVSIGYSGGTGARIDVTDLIWKTAHVRGFMFSLFGAETIDAARRTLLELLELRMIGPTVARAFPLEEAAEAQRHLIEDRPYGRVLLTF
ncbi:quinone oxidoreductase family protein [Spirillospora sp. CA-294931]|uniref:quinone oxidoreductase family protein n=1 Tax=Spirillospora sp. CA-294931 TaxID=3240042 RepID=UPI003D91D08E